MSYLSHTPLSGGTFFVTARLVDPSSDMLVRHVDQLRCAMRQTMYRHPFRIDAIAILPNALHTIWTVSDGDDGVPCRWNMVKTLFQSKASGPRPRWQSRLWQHKISDLRDFNAHRHVILHSPVHAGLCDSPDGWLHSSIHRDSQTAHWMGMNVAPLAFEAAVA